MDVDHYSSFPALAERDRSSEAQWSGDREEEREGSRETEGEHSAAEVFIEHAPEVSRYTQGK